MVAAACELLGALLVARTWPPQVPTSEASSRGLHESAAGVAFFVAATAASLLD